MRSIAANQTVLMSNVKTTPVAIPIRDIASGTTIGRSIAPAIGVIATILRNMCVIRTNQNC